MSQTRLRIFFIGWVYAITTDGGQTWTVWNALDDLPDWKPANYRLIEDVSLTREGSGPMRCNVIESRRGPVT